MKKEYILLLTFFLFSLSTIPQSNKENLTLSKFSNVSQENIYIHLNTNFLLTGENLLYKIYCLYLKNKKLTTLSKMAYVKIIDHNNKEIFKQKVKLKNGSGYGNLLLPNYLETGTYKIIGYTQWMRNKQLFYEENLYIVNPFTSPNNKVNTSSNNKFEEKPNIDASFLSTNKKNYSKREKVTLSFDQIIKGSFSISVRKIDKLNLPHKASSIKFFNTPNKELKTYHIPELRGELIRGKIKSKNGNNNLADIKIGFSLLGKNIITKTSITNNSGDFYFNINEPYNDSEIITQILSNDRHLYNIEIKKDLPLERVFKDFDSINLTKELVEIIKKRSINLQIENAYNSVKKDVFHKKELNKLIFESKAYIINLNDYTRFKTVKETVVEILHNVWLDGDNNFHVKNLKSGTNRKLPTLLIVDGYILFNHNDFLDFNARKIKTISVLGEKYIMGAQLFEGILLIKTFEGDYKPNSNHLKKFDLIAPQKEKDYFFQTHNSKKETKRIPDYRTQLFWKPNLDLTQKEISFYTSDIGGNFQIKIEGFTNKGKPISIMKKFTVN